MALDHFTMMENTFISVCAFWDIPIESVPDSVSELEARTVLPLSVLLQVETAGGTVGLGG